MKATEYKKIRTLATAILAVVSANAMASQAPLIKELPHNVYHVIQNKTLRDAADQLANRTGITFKINADLENDAITHKIVGDDWNMGLHQLLAGYNHSIIAESGIIKTVVITGRNGSGLNKSADNSLGTEMIVVAPDYANNLPERYKNFKPGSVMNVNLPMDQLAEVPIGKTFTLDLPIGQYNVVHDNAVEHADGSSTWIGYLDDEGKGYRVYLSQGDAGVIGNVFTPDGAYNIETVDGKTVVVDLDKSGLQTAGFEGDQQEAMADESVTMNDAVGNSSNLDALRTAAETARATANALTAEANALYQQYLVAKSQADAGAQTVASLSNALNAAKTALANARTALNKDKKNSALKAAVNSAQANVNNLTAQLSQANSTNKTAQSNATQLKSSYDKKYALAVAAETKAKTAEATYAAASVQTTANATVSTTTSSSNAVVDLMVLYTTVNQTATYAKQRIAYLVDVSNQSYKDSGINMSLRLVHARPTTYVESNSNSQALSDLAYDKGAFAGTAALRNKYGADLVMLFRPLYAKTAGSCGTTYVGFANGGAANAKFGFGTIGDGYSKDSMTNYYCGANTFTHEIGHTLGNVHDRTYSSFQGKFSYSYAWGISGKFGTVMSYYGPSVMLFATPNLSTQCAGSACGFAEGDTNSSDQTRTTNYTAPLVANYRSTTTTVPVIQ